MNAKPMDNLQSLPRAPLAPGSGSLPIAVHETFRRCEPGVIPAEQLIPWIRAFHGLLQSAAGAEDFYDRAARALVELVKLDVGRVLFLRESEWAEQARHVSRRGETAPSARPSSRILGHVVCARKTFWQAPEPGASTWDIEAVVAAPILDRRGAVIGALYGERRLSSARHLPISQLEAMLVEVLASGVATGLARLDQERAALRTRLQLEQFFTPRLAARLADQPELLDGRDSDISVLFCDIRGFSRFAEKLGPARTVALMSDVMSALTQCVLDHDGIVVDYVGDEVMAMWGAPEAQPDHARRACRAALAMFAALPSLNQRWQAILGEPLDFSIGINTGLAQVGNVGSRMKFKYGALGNTVNLGSRVQGANKYLHTALLITAATRARLDDSFRVRRLCQARVVNIAEPVTLFELAVSPPLHWDHLKLGYEQALDQFTRGEFRLACRILGKLIADHPHDGPALLLLSRAVACLVQKPDPFDPALVPAGK